MRASSRLSWACRSPPAYAPATRPDASSSLCRPSRSLSMRAACGSATPAAEASARAGSTYRALPRMRRGLRRNRPTQPSRRSGLGRASEQQLSIRGCRVIEAPVADCRIGCRGAEDRKRIDLTRKGLLGGELAIEDLEPLEDEEPASDRLRRRNAIGRYSLGFVEAIPDGVSDHILAVGH